MRRAPGSPTESSPGAPRRDGADSTGPLGRLRNGRSIRGGITSVIHVTTHREVLGVLQADSWGPTAGPGPSSLGDHQQIN